MTREGTVGRDRTESTLGNGCFFYPSDRERGRVWKTPNRERDRGARSQMRSERPISRAPINGRPVLFRDCRLGKGWQHGVKMTLAQVSSDI